MRFGICLPTRANVAENAHLSHLHLVAEATAWGIDKGGVGLHFTPRAHIARARSQMAERSLEVGNEWTLWVDDDAIVPPNTLEHLLAVSEATNANAVAALCYTRRSDLRAPSSRFAETDNGLVEVPFDGEGWINTTGFHCVLVNAEVIKAVRATLDEMSPGNNVPLFQEPVVGAKHAGEDRFFWAIAEKSGVLRLWHTRTLCAGHLMSIVLNEKTRPHLLAAMREMIEAAE